MKTRHCSTRTETPAAQLAALAAGAAAAVAAFATTEPGYRRWIVLLPLVPLAVWLGDLGQWGIQDGVASGSSQ